MIRRNFPNLEIPLAQEDTRMATSLRVWPHFIPFQNPLQAHQSVQAFLLRSGGARA